MRKTRGKWVVLALLTLAVVASATILLIYHNAERLDDWLGRQLVGIANNHLAPDLAFGSLEFQPPGIIVLHDVTLTPPSPREIATNSANGSPAAQPAKAPEPVIDIDRLEIVLGEVPRIGRPLQIVALTIEDGVIRIHRDPETGDIAGLVPIVDEDLKQEGGAEDVPGQFRLSSVMRLEQINLVDLSIEYREGDGLPMELAGISTKLLIDSHTARGTGVPPVSSARNTATPPVSPNAALPTALPAPPEPGWYDVALDVGRAPGLTLRGDGRFNLDTFTLDLADLHLSMTVDPTTVESLPPPLQTLLRSHNASGALSLAASGVLPLTDPLSAVMTGRLRLRDFELAAGDYQFPLRTLDTPLEVRGGVAKVGPLHARIFDGAVDAFISANLAGDRRAADLEWTITDLDLNKLLRAPAPARALPRLTAATGDPPPPTTADLSAAPAVTIGGLVAGAGAASTTLSDPKGNLAGRGAIQITQGNLLFLPGLTQIADLMKLVLRAEGTHTLHADFSLSPKGVTITDAEVVTEVLAARASGLIAFDGSLNIALNAGPLERLQATLGQIGDIFGAITDKLMTYHLRGTVEDPKVSVEVF